MTDQFPFNKGVIRSIMGKQKESKFQPQLVALADFANGTRFKIDQVKRSGACRITDLNTEKSSYSSSIPNAWKSVRYQAGIVHRTENTSGWRG